ncbi:hypothetical protein GBAR_LOCUS18255 [Geodia barretti]|uniref:Uncharacterized protein n=1 Tax=Geodia barretti TaxID=519541 RepID=A0AA35WZC3_GEOBA|nr:hypothetical protein GBAR_LOCUS18255 [Geodia barretti]
MDRETFTVSFSHISGYEVHPDFSTATVTIIDDDSATTSPPTTPPPVPGNIENVRSPGCGRMSGMLQMEGWRTLLQDKRIVLSSPTNSLSFTDQDVPTQRPLYAIIKGRNSNGVHSTSWSTP